MQNVNFATTHVEIIGTTMFIGGHIAEEKNIFFIPQYRAYDFQKSFKGVSILNGDGANAFVQNIDEQAARQWAADAMLKADAYYKNAVLHYYEPLTGSGGKPAKCGTIKASLFFQTFSENDVWHICQTPNDKRFLDPEFMQSVEKLVRCDSGEATIFAEDTVQSLKTRASHRRIY